MARHGGKFRLSKIVLDEISLVGAGDDPMALTVLSKAAECDCDTYTGGERNGDGEKVCERCGGILKMAGCAHKRKGRGRCRDCGEKLSKESPSYNELREDLLEAWGRKDTYIEDLGTDWVIFGTYGNGELGKSTEYIKVGYTITNDVVAFGVQTVVERKVRWEADNELDKGFRFANLMKRRDNSTRPSPKSTPKEIVGHHGHHAHGPSILWPALYEHLRAKGKSKSAAAAISNAAWKKKRMGMATNTPTSARGAL